ncbi:EAL domain-containing protein [Novosphingobium sp. 9U]|uniref:EAL domain-containing protein n=1 Tax=Novosphingobium sp. 9U TaxID=2653158 RepID=UPI0012F1E6A0|nr:EAL domain-containing protein [Novosphingobium sp. 9U]VWX46461.1 Diguanylate phosphodiesterase [Novosphingobium sp. 9U]
MILLSRLKAAWRHRRSRIVISALLIGAVCGVLGVTVPLEDLFIAARTKLRSENASGQIVIVKIDDRSLEALHDNDVNPGLDAQVVENLMKAGATSVYFNRTYPFSDQTAGAAKLIKTLDRYPGRVYLGASMRAGGSDATLSRVPAKAFRQHARLVSLAVVAHPLNLSFSFPYMSKSTVGRVQSLSAALADQVHETSRMFRADFAIDHQTIPTVSYIDVLNGRITPAQFSGRKAVVGLTASSSEQHPLPLGDFVPSVYFHVIAAETLIEQNPTALGWVPAFLLVAVMMATGIGRGRSFKPLRLAGYALILLVFPTVLDRYGVEVTVLPAAIMAIYATVRARTLDKIKDVSETNAASGLPSLQALRDMRERSSGLLVALKIRNYSGILRSFEGAVEADLAAEIQRRIRISEPEVVVYHEGGMFVWLSNLTDIVELFENLEGLHRIVQNGIVIDGTEVDVGFNCGVDSELQNTIANRLANAMQSAEEAVRSDELVCHHDGAKGEVQWEISLLASLDRAIDNGEVWVAFQPKLDLLTNKVIGAEALARWSHPERGPISPEKFIGIAEEYHRIERITRFVLDKAVRAAASFVREGHEFSISVNISAQLLRNPRLPRMVLETLAAHDLDPAHLILEITETDRLDRSAKTVQMMEELVAAGLRISIDDFGTGNATIDYLRYLPAAEVKIDKSFIREIDTNPGDHLLVQSIIEMAHSLGRQVVAEGVETAESLALLRSLQCDQVQGYYVGRPVSFRDFVVHLAEKSVRTTG